jgi:hypothetical protein
MSNLRVTAASAICALLGLNPTIAQAGPCTADIAQFEAAIRQSAGNPFAGLTARQSVNAQLGRQPTPESLHQANARLKSQFSATMARAKRYDAQGNRSGCTRALNAAKQMYIP